MSTFRTRRQFLQSAGAASAAIGMSELGFLDALPRVSAAEAQPQLPSLQSGGDVLALVKTIEDTPREKLLEEIAARIRRGVSYREIVAALLLAGVRNVRPRPVGFKFHAVLVVNSAHLASISSPDEHRWLPIFWALDSFKDAQAQEVKASHWTLPAVDEAAVPPAHKAANAFKQAMDNWDEAAADVAITGLVRTAGMHEIYELLFRYGCRDFRDIGHKAIYVANSLRTLACVGWEYAEPVLRSVTLALLEHEGDNPAKRDGAPDQAGRRNLERIGKIQLADRTSAADDAVTRDMLDALRDGSHDAVCDKTVELLNRGVAVQSLWDALHVGAGELLMRQPGIVGLHAVTSTNALHYAFRTAADESTRRLLLLQNAAFLPQFRAAMQERGKLDAVRLDDLQPFEQPAAGEAAIKDIFAEISKDRLSAAKKVLAYATANPQPKQLIDMARVLVFLKGNNAHDYKFSSALLEDYSQISSGWRQRYLASGVFNLRGSGDSDNPLTQRTRAALQS